MTCEITTSAQFLMRRLIRGWKREMEEKRAAEDEKLLHAMTERFNALASKQTPIESEFAEALYNNRKELYTNFTSDNLRLCTVRPWQPSDDEPDGGSAA